MSKPENREVDKYILENLPSTFGELSGKRGAEWYRPIDRRLQFLRKKGIISFHREGRKAIWSKL